MKKMTIIIAIALVLCLVIGCVACEKPETAAQGVDTVNHVIKVGNTAATTGNFAGVGLPFNYAQEAYFWYFTEHLGGYKDADGNK